MSYTGLQLITRAYYLSQIVARELQTVTQAQLSDGLFILNALLDFKSTDTRLIPYYKRYEFDAEAGTEEYFIEGLLNIDTLTFNIGQVRYSLDEFTRSQYFSVSRVDNIQSLPFCFRKEREKGGSRIYLYYVPADDYPMKLEGKFALDEVLLTTDLSTVYDLYYIEYLRYELANMICGEYGVTFPDASMQMLKEYRKKLLAVSPPDLSIQGDNYFGEGIGMDWQMANLFKGYLP